MAEESQKMINMLRSAESLLVSGNKVRIYCTHFEADRIDNWFEKNYIKHDDVELFVSSRYGEYIVNQLNGLIPGAGKRASNDGVYNFLSPDVSLLVGNVIEQYLHLNHRNYGLSNEFMYLIKDMASIICLLASAVIPSKWKNPLYAGILKHIDKIRKPLKDLNVPFDFKS